MKQFKLTDSDKETLKSFGYLAQDFSQIVFAANEIDYFYLDKKISSYAAEMILGRKRFLSGVARVAFHRTAVRCANDDETKTVLFDGGLMWTRWTN